MRAACSIALSTSARDPTCFSRQARTPSVAPVTAVTSVTSPISAREIGGRRRVRGLGDAGPVMDGGEARPPGRSRSDTRWRAGHAGNARSPWYNYTTIVRVGGGSVTRARFVAMLVAGLLTGGIASVA